MGNWKDSLRAFSGVDERKLIGWLQETKARMGKSITSRFPKIKKKLNKKK